LRWRSRRCRQAPRSSAPGCAEASEILHERPADRDDGDGEPCRAQKATLNGTSGPNVAGGDVMNYFSNRIDRLATNAGSRPEPSARVGPESPAATAFQRQRKYRRVSPGCCHARFTSSSSCPRTLTGRPAVATALSRRPSRIQWRRCRSPRNSRAWPSDHGAVHAEVHCGRDDRADSRQAGRQTHHPGVRRAGTYAKKIKTPQQTGTYTSPHPRGVELRHAEEGQHNHGRLSKRPKRASAARRAEQSRRRDPAALAEWCGA
jgi:hypothetical protein